MAEYAIGLDIGVASVGWAVVALDNQERPCGIIRMGSRIFDAAEHPKTGDSLASPRRAARSARRRLRRHRHRNGRIRYLLVEKRVLTQAQLDKLFSGQLEDIYALRVRALNELLSQEEFARVLIHLSQRRGFRSNRKNPSTDEDGLILSAVNKNKQEMENNGYRTVGEMLLKDSRFAQHKRNKGGEYIATVSRQEIEDEVRLIFAAQRACGSEIATAELEEAYCDILLSQRSFDEGPGGSSPYTGAIRPGNCTFLPECPRAAKATYSFEYFSLLEKVNHIRIRHKGVLSPLSPCQREQVIALAHTTENLDFARIRKELSLSSDTQFNVVSYQSDDFSAWEKKTKLGCLKAYHQMRKAFDKVKKGLTQSISVEQRNTIATALTLHKTSAKIREYLLAAQIPDHLLEAVESLGNFSKFGHLSVAACDAIIPYLEQGMNYSDACTAAGFQFKGHSGKTKSMLLHPTQEDYDSITSPVVRRSISQTIKVVNAIIRAQGRSPLFIHVELAREMSKDFSERKKIERDMLSNQAVNERIIDRLRTEFGIRSPSGLDLVKLKLYEQQQGVCPYSQKQLSLSQIFDPNYAEIDHIIPYSISFDDSYKNKVLVFAVENRNKGNRLPLQYLTEDRRNRFIVWVQNEVRDYKKRQLLLKEDFAKEDEERFKERSLHDTKTASRFILNYLNDNLLFAESRTGKKKHVIAVNGAITAHMRRRWGISKVRANGDIHHAVDALVVACTTDGMIQQVSRYSAYKECQYITTEAAAHFVDPSTGEVIKSFPHPWPQFHKELTGHLSSNPETVLMDLRLPMYVSGEITPPTSPVFVSRMPTHKITGAAHKDTVKSPKMLAEGKVVVKKSLQEITLKDLKESYYDKQSDRLLYEALVARLEAFNDDAKKAFAEPFYKPKSDGTPGPLVKKIKLCEPTTLNVSLHEGNGVADNDSMVRVDVFYVEDDGYYLVPIYVADTVRAELPTKACVAHKPYDRWKVMREEDFIFSLYPNDLIRITSKKPITFSKNLKDSDLADTIFKYSIEVYYKGMNISSGAIECITHDNAYKKSSLGVKTLECIEKLTVDVLGDYHKVNKEIRQPFCRNKG